MLEDLIGIGMTEYEAKVYLALLSEYPSNGYQLSKTSGIPRSMVYEALGRLQVRGAVLKSEEEKAALYRPVPPDALLQRYQTEVERRLTYLRKSLGPLYKERSDLRVWNFSSRDEALRQARKLIEEAQRELMLVMTDPDVSALGPSLREAHERGVTLGVLLTGDADFNLGEAVRHPHRETELHHIEETLIVVRDEQEMLVASGHKTTSATLSSNANLVLISRQFVWMELFAQRIFRRLGPELLDRLDPEDRRVLNDEVISDYRGMSDQSSP